MARTNNVNVIVRYVVLRPKHFTTLNGGYFEAGFGLVRYVGYGVEYDFEEEVRLTSMAILNLHFKGCIVSRGEFPLDIFKFLNL